MLACPYACYMYVRKSWPCSKKLGATSIQRMLTENMRLYSWLEVHWMWLRDQVVSVTCNTRSHARSSVTEGTGVGKNVSMCGLRNKGTIRQKLSWWDLDIRTYGRDTRNRSKHPSTLPKSLCRCLLGSLAQQARCRSKCGIAYTCSRSLSST